MSKAVPGGTTRPCLSVDSLLRTSRRRFNSCPLPGAGQTKTPSHLRLGKGRYLKRRVTFEVLFFKLKGPRTVLILAKGRHHHQHLAKGREMRLAKGRHQHLAKGRN